jgi:hypothetical protein
MAAEKLYDIALQYKSTKLWKQLYDTELFAVRLSCGEIGYCSVMGELGEHIALALYIGQDGLDSYRRLFDATDSQSILAQRETMMAQSCLQCSFENKDELLPFEIEEAQSYFKARSITSRGQKAFPMFRKYMPARYPWLLEDAAEEQALCEALSAAVEITERLKTTDKESLGFVNDEPYEHAVPLLEKSGDGYRVSAARLPDKQKMSYPSPSVHDELLLAKLKRKKRPGMTWVCEVTMLPEAVSDEGEDEGADALVVLPRSAPYFPYILLIADQATGMIVPGDIVKDFYRNADQLVEYFAQCMLERGVPSELRVRDARTQTFLSAFAGQIGIKIVRCDQLPLLDEIEEDMAEHFLEESCQSEEEAQEAFLEMLSELDDETLRSMPRELRKQLLDLDSQGSLPEPVSKRIRRLFM